VVALDCDPASRILPDHRLIGALRGFTPIVCELRGRFGSCGGRHLLSQFYDSAQGRMPQVKLPFLPRGHHPMVAAIKKCKTFQRTISSPIALTQKANEWLPAGYKHLRTVRRFYVVNFYCLLIKYVLRHGCESRRARVPAAPAPPLPCPAPSPTLASFFFPNSGTATKFCLCPFIEKKCYL
jgi:hypothetical protein